MIKRQIIGHKYTNSKFDESEFSVETDYVNGKIYLGMSENAGNIDAVAAYAETVLVAVRDMRKHEEKEAARDRVNNG